MFPSVPRLTVPCAWTLSRALRQKLRILVAVSVAAGTLAVPACALQAKPALHANAAVRDAQNSDAPVLLDAMTGELRRAFTALGKQGPNSADANKQVPPYFLSYSVADADMVSIRAQYGSLVDSSGNRARMADVQIRLGDPNLDNTHGSHRGS